MSNFFILIGSSSLKELNWSETPCPKKCNPYRGVTLARLRRATVGRSLCRFDPRIRSSSGRSFSFIPEEAEREWILLSNSVARAIDLSQIYRSRRKCRSHSCVRDQGHPKKNADTLGYPGKRRDHETTPLFPRPRGSPDYSQATTFKYIPGIYIIYIYITYSYERTSIMFFS